MAIKHVFAKLDDVESLKYYGEINVTPSDSNLFEFLVNEYDMSTVSVKAINTNISGNIIIPHKVDRHGDEFSVSGLCPNAFENCEFLESVVIPSSIKIIDDYAFNNCTNLNQLSIPESVTTIGINAFSNTKLINIELSDNVTSIADNAFENSTLESITCSHGSHAEQYAEANEYDIIYTKISKKLLNSSSNIQLGEGTGSVISGTSTADGEQSVALGKDNIAEANYSIALGESNRAISDNAIAIGYSSTAGCKGFYISAIDFTNRKLYLTNTQVLPV